MESAGFIYTATFSRKRNKEKGVGEKGMSYPLSGQGRLGEASSGRQKP